MRARRHTLEQKCRMPLAYSLAEKCLTLYAPRSGRILFVILMPEATASATRSVRARNGLVPRRITSVRLFEISVSLVTLSVLIFPFLFNGIEPFRGPVTFLGVLFWTLTIAVVELLPVPAWKSLQLSIGGPLFMAAAFIYPPEIAGVIAFLGASDPREFKRVVRPMRALFNRSQISISVFLAALMFHTLGGRVDSWRDALPAALAAVLVDYAINSALVSVAVSLDEGLRVIAVIKKLRIGSLPEFLVSYIGLGFLGVMLARLYLEVGWWAVAAFVLPLLLARQMFFRTRALEDATKELKDREVVLRGLSNRMAEERHDERMQIAGYLHDDMAQMLFRLSLHADILSKQLDSGNKEGVERELEGIRQARARASQLLRALIKDLRLSPLGRAGVSEALRSFCSEVRKDYQVAVTTELDEVQMPPPIQLLCYQLAREAVMNAVKHAEASTVKVALEPTGVGARVTISDDGNGFDVEEGSPEGHFGLTMMRERALVAGGTFDIISVAGEGTTITAEFPTSWLSDGDGAQSFESVKRETPA
jgi:signal transduction histidine kinase